MNKVFIYSLLFVFGGAIMALEMLAPRMMAPYFGESIVVWGSIISSVMVHLAVGYYLGGVFFKRSPRMLFFLLVLMGAGLWVAAVPLAYRPMFAFIAEQVGDLKAGAMLAVNVVYFFPLCLMAMVPPFCVGMLTEKDAANPGFSTGKSLFVSTAGAFLGTNLTSFYLIGVFPISRIVQGIGLICFALCLFGVFIERAASRPRLGSGLECLREQR